LEYNPVFIGFGSMEEFGFLKNPALVIEAVVASLKAMNLRLGLPVFS